MDKFPVNLFGALFVVCAIAALMSTYGGEKPAHAASKFSARVFLDGQP